MAQQQILPQVPVIKELEDIIDSFTFEIKIKEDIRSLVPINASHDDCTILSLGYAFAVTLHEAERRLLAARQSLSWNGNTGYTAAYVNLVVAANLLSGLSDLDRHKPNNFVRNGGSYGNLGAQVTALAEKLGVNDEPLWFFAETDSVFYPPQNPRWLRQLNERSEGRTDGQFTNAVLQLMESQEGLHY